VAGSHFKIWQFLNGKLARRNQVWLVTGAFHKAMAKHWNFPFPSIAANRQQELAL
jgi:hypothetical protein